MLNCVHCIYITLTQKSTDIFMNDEKRWEIRPKLLWEPERNTQLPTRRRMCEDNIKTDFKDIDLKILMGFKCLRSESNLGLFEHSN